MNSGKSSDFIFTARCTRDTPVMRPGQESLAKNTMRATCAHRRARMISLTGFLNFCARGLPLQPCQHHRDHLPHRQMDINIVNVFAIIGAVIVRAVVLLNIAAVGAIFIIVADLVDVILSSRTPEQRHRAYLHQRLMQRIIGIEDAIIDVVVGRAAVARIMSFAKQVAGGRVGCLREQWRWRPQDSQV